MVEVEVTDKEHAISIREIRAMNNNLVVVSMLEELSLNIGDKKMRISDQITLNAPDLNVKYYIIGEKPNRVFNGRFKYFKNMDALNAKVGSDYKVIYKK